MPKRAYQTKTRIFKNAGFFVLRKRLASGSLTTDPKDIYTSDSAIIQSITTKYSTTTEKMEDGNSFFPAAEHVTGVEATAEVVLNTFDPKLWEFTVGAFSVTTQDGYYWSTAEQYVIPEDGKVKLNASALKKDSLVLARKIDGDDFMSETDFTVDYDTAELTFSSPEEIVGTVIYVTCLKKSSVVTTSSVPAIPSMTSYRFMAIGENCDKNETDVVADNFVISNVTVSGDISLPTRQKAYNSVTMTFTIGTPAPGENAIDRTSAVKSERSADDPAADATLSTLKIGSLTLEPTFSPEVIKYTTETTNPSDVITATATAAGSGATVEIKNGETVVESGSAATWASSENTVTVKVTNGSATKTYTVTVTKSD